MEPLSDDIYPSSLLSASLGGGGKWVSVFDPEDLIRIHNTGVNLVVWSREVRPAVRKWLDQEHWCTFPREPFHLSHTSARRDLAEHVAKHCPTPSPGRRMFIDDLVMLAERFTAVTDLSQLTARLVPVIANACSRFHVDYVTERLLTTYVGHGTEWFDQAGDVVPAGIETPIAQMPRFSVALFKGSCHPTVTRPPVHRSPPTPGPTGKRLVFCLDGGR